MAHETQVQARTVVFNLLAGREPFAIIYGGTKDFQGKMFISKKVASTF